MISARLRPATSPDAPAASSSSLEPSGVKEECEPAVCVQVGSCHAYLQTKICFPVVIVFVLAASHPPEVR